MPGMNSGLNLSNSVIVAAFQVALIDQLYVALLIFTVLSFGWILLREGLPGASAAARRAAAGRSYPAWREVLRIGFGLIWVFDGILQAQPAMAVGLPSQVIEPIAASSPHWVQVVVNWAGTAWSYHPVQAAASAVWIQFGIGLWLLLARHGALSRLAGLASVGWGLVVWVFGESFGGVFAPGLTWLFGAPGAALVYCVAGGLIALPEKFWRSPRLGRQMLAAMGVFLVGMAVLQAWPGRGFWQGRYHGKAGTLAGMIHSMAQIPQPSALAHLVSGFASLVQAHGFAVNLFAVIALAGIGAAFLTGRAVIIRPAVIAMTMLCLADWVLIEDFGFLGGLGTDPNSMIPMALVAIAGYLALVQVPVPVTQRAGESAPPSFTDPASRLTGSWLSRVRPSVVSWSVATTSVGTVGSIGAVAVILLGAIPMAAAQANPVASPILAQALGGPAVPLNSVAPSFTLTAQNGKQATLPSLRGKVIVLTFVGSVCATTDCRVIAQEFRQASTLLGANRRRVELVAVNLDPLHTGIAYTRAFDRQEGLASVPNWLYLTGSPAQLTAVWHSYGLAPRTLPAGAVPHHSSVAFLIDTSGRLRRELHLNPGPGTAATQSSFAAELADAALHLIDRSEQ